MIVSRGDGISVVSPPIAMAARPARLARLRRLAEPEEPTASAVTKVEIEEGREDRGVGSLIGGDGQEMADRRDAPRARRHREAASGEGGQAAGQAKGAISPAPSSDWTQGRERVGLVPRATGRGEIGAEQRAAGEREDQPSSSPASGCISTAAPAQLSADPARRLTVGGSRQIRMPSAPDTIGAIRKPPTAWAIGTIPSAAISEVIAP